MEKSNVKTSIIVGAAAGIAIGAAVGYWIYRRRCNQFNEEKDEGIGDVDSIISDGEVEGENLSRNASNAIFNTASFEQVKAEGNHRKVRDVATRSSNNGGNFSEFSGDRPALKPMKVLVLGLNESGKTCMLNILAHQESKEYAPTIGFNTVRIDKEDVALSIVEVGGSASTRNYWTNFTSDTTLLIYVIDSANAKRFKEAKSALKEVLESSSLENVDLLLIANKQDLEESTKAEQIVSSKFLDELSKKGVSNITLYNSTCITRKDGSNEGDILMDIIVGLLKQRL